jgi:hypothetical protein
MARPRFCATLAGVLALTCGALVYQFVFRGEVATSPDGRTAVLLGPGERDIVLAEMRHFLEAVQQISAGVQQRDMAAVEKAGRAAGAAAAHGVPASLMGKLPLDFKRLGLDTHQRFDALALDAGQLADPDHALAQLSELLGNCVACHSAYRIELVQP